MTSCLGIKSNKVTKSDLTSELRVTKEVTDNQRTQLIEIFSELNVKRTELEKLKLETKLYEKQNRKLHSQLGLALKEVKELRGKTRKHKSRAHRYKRENDVLTDHLKRYLPALPSLDSSTKSDDEDSGDEEEYELISE